MATRRLPRRDHDPQRAHAGRSRAFGRSTWAVPTWLDRRLPPLDIEPPEQPTLVVKVTVTFYSTDPAHTGTVTTRAAGPFIEIDHADGTVTTMGIGQDGHVMMPGEGLVWAEIGITKIEVDASGNVTEVQHGISSPTTAGSARCSDRQI